MAAVKISRCTCKHEFQDKEYGKGMRVMNLRDPKKHPNKAYCTVCGKEVDL